MNVLIRPARHEDVAALVPRRQDRDELWAGFHHTPEQALAYGLAEAPSWYAEIQGEPAAIFGCVPDASGWAAPWAIFTETIERYPMTFLRHSRKPIEDMKARYRKLVNAVDARNTHVVRWLAWHGFTIYPAQPFGVEQLPFHRFEWVHV